VEKSNTVSRLKDLGSDKNEPRKKITVHSNVIMHCFDEMKRLKMLEGSVAELAVATTFPRNYPLLRKNLLPELNHNKCVVDLSAATDFFIADT